MVANACREGDKLSPREEQYLNLLARGRRPAEICKEWGVNNKTLNGHMKNIKIKMGTRTSWESIYVWGTRRGLVGGRYVFF